MSTDGGTDLFLLTMSYTKDKQVIMTSLKGVCLFMVG